MSGAPPQSFPFFSCHGKPVKEASGTLHTTQNWHPTIAVGLSRRRICSGKWDSSMATGRTMLLSQLEQFYPDSRAMSYTATYAKPDTESHTWFHLCETFKTGKSIKTKSRLVVARQAWGDVRGEEGEERMGNDSWIGMRSPFGWW